MDSIALLVLDAQDCFIETLHNKDDFLKRCAFVIEAARCLRIHTIFTEQVPEKLGRSNKQLFKLAGKPKIFSKSSFSALNAPGMERYLREKEIYHLIVCGLETPICVYQTGLQAVDEDIDITFLTDALSCRRPEDEAATLRALKDLGCQLLPSESVFYSLLGDVGNHYFRAFNSLVKAYASPSLSLEERVMAQRIADEAKAKQKSPRPSRNEDRPSRREGDSDSKKEPVDESASPEETETSRSEKSASKRRPRKRKPKSDTPRERKPTSDAPDGSISEETPKSVDLESPRDDAEAAKAPAKKTARKRAAKKAAKKTAKKSAKKTAKKTSSATLELSVQES